MKSLDFILYYLRWGGSKKTRLIIMISSFFTVFTLATVVGSIVLPEVIERVSRLDVQESPKSSLTVYNVSVATRKFNEITDNKDSQPDENYIALEKKVRENKASQHLIKTPRDQIVLARYYMRLGLNGNAISVLDGVSEDAQAYREASMLSGEAYLRRREYNEALMRANNIAGTPEANFLQARLYYAMGDKVRAIKLLDRLKRQTGISPSFNARLWGVLARLALDDNDFNTAYQAIEKAQELNEGFAPGADQNTALKLNEWNHKLVHLEVLIRNGKFRDADEQLIDLETFARDHPAIQELRGLYFAATGNFRVAGQILESLKGWSGGSLRRPLLRAVLKRESGDSAQAKRIINDHLSKAPNDWLALSLLGDLYWRDQQYDQVNEVISALDEYAPSPKLAAFYRYRLAIAQENYDLALESLDQIIRYDPEGSFDLVGAGAPAETILLGIKARSVVKVRDQSSDFRRRLKARQLLITNQPQKALAFYDHQTSAEKGEKHPLDQLIYAELLLESFRDQEASAVLSTLPLNVRQTKRTAILSLRLSRRLSQRGQKPGDIASAIANFAENAENEGKPLKSLGLHRILLMDALRRQDVHKAREMVSANWKIIDDHDVYVVLSEQILTELKNNLSVNESNLNRFATELAIRGLTLINNRDVVVPVAQLFEQTGHQDKAALVLKEAVLKHSDDWHILSAYLNRLRTPTEKRAGSAFLRAVAKNTRTNRVDDYAAIDAALDIASADEPSVLRASIEDVFNRTGSPMAALAIAETYSLEEVESELMNKKVIELLQKASEKPDLNHKTRIEIAEAMVRFEGVNEAAILLEAGIESEKSISISKKIELIQERSALIAERARASSKPELQKDIVYARWAVLMNRPGLVTDRVLRDYALAMERAGYEQFSAPLKRELETSLVENDTRYQR